VAIKIFSHTQNKSKEELSNHPSWLSFTLALVTGLFLLIYFFNNILPYINFHTLRWEAPYLFPPMEPFGADFRDGYYKPALTLLEGKSPYLENELIYPPFSALFSVPFTFFPVETSYAIHVGLLFFLNTATVFLAIDCLRQTWQKTGVLSNLFFHTAIILLFVLFSFYTLTSYGFIFSAERGNFDIYPQFFSVAALWLLLKRPSKIWLPVILISLATHLKIYPAILFILILWVHGRKSLLPVLLMNLFLLLITGVDNAIDFLKTIVDYSLDPYLWIGNHSAASFAAYLNQFVPEILGFSLPQVLFYLAPITLWILGFLFLSRWKGRLESLSTIFLFVLSVPLMNLLPVVSHDYKLVILSAPLAILLLVYFWEIANSSRNSAALYVILKIVLLLLLMFGIARSSVYTHPLFKNKYPLILMVQLLSLLEIASMGHFLQLPRSLLLHPAGHPPHFEEVDREIQPTP
jgi:uncharacterized membrane protein